MIELFGKFVFLQQILFKYYFKAVHFKENWSFQS